MRFGEDGNFSLESMIERHNADLANGIGNLASRVLAMLASYFDGVVPIPKVEGSELNLPEVIADAMARYDANMMGVRLQPALVAVWDVVARANLYLVEKEPWKLSSDEGRRDELASVLYAAAETLRILAIAIQPIMPGAALRLWEQLGLGMPLSSQRLPADAAWGGLAPGTATTKGNSLFPRVEAE
jgi:methionyl-tRNA synthetase